MSDAVPAHFVFVDFENVPEIDLEAISGQPVHVTLLIGKNQKKIDLALVEQIQAFAAQVKIVKVGASGHNALDLTLACYLGRAIELTIKRTPAASFAIVSKDKDFAPMIAHLLDHNVAIARYDGFTALPFLHHRQPAAPAKAQPTAAAKSPAAKKSAEERRAKSVSSGNAPLPADRFEKLVARLGDEAQPRPKKKSRLLARINTDFGNKLTEAECELKLNDLINRGVVSIDANEKVSYFPAR